MQLVQLQKDMAQIEAAGAGVVGISYDSPEVLAEFAKSGKIKYPLLSDKDSAVIDAYQVRNADAKGRQAGIPHPMTFVVSAEGIVTAKLPGTVRTRHSTADLLEALK